MKNTPSFPKEKWDFGTRDMLKVLTADEYEYLIERQTIQKYKKGETVFKEGHIPSGFFFIKAGKVKKYKTDKDGREQIIYIAREKEFIGYHAVLAEERYPDSASTLENCQLCFIPQEDFFLVLKNSPLLNAKLIKTLSHEFTVLSNNLSISFQRTAIERLAIALLFLNEKYNYNPQEPTNPILLSRRDLANIVGLAQENIIRLLKELKDEGAIRIEGKEIWIDNESILIGRTNYF